MAFLLLLIFFWPCHMAYEISFPRTRIIPGPWQWKPGVLTTRPPGNSQAFKIITMTNSINTLIFLITFLFLKYKEEYILRF